MQSPEEIALTVSEDAFTHERYWNPRTFAPYIAAALRAYGADCAAQAEEQLKHTKAKLNQQAALIEKLEKARDFWRQKYNDAKVNI